MHSLWKHTHRGNGQRANSLGRDAPWPQNPHLTRHRGEHTLDTSRTKTKNKRSALFLAIPLVPVHQPCLPVPPPRVCSWKRNKMMINVMLMSLLFFFFYIYTAVDWREQTRPSKGIWRVGGVCVCVWMLKGDSGGAVWGRQVVLMGLRDSLCSLFAYIWQPSVLIGLGDVSIRRGATAVLPEDRGVAPTLCSRPSAFMQRASWCHRLNWHGEGEALRFGGMRVRQGEPYGLLTQAFVQNSL